MRAHNNSLVNNTSVSNNKNVSDRAIKGYAIISKGDIPQIVNEELFIVPSQSSDKKYIVNVKNGYSCECPDFRLGGNKCKHIYAVEFLLKMREKFNSDNLDIPDDVVKEIKCIFCKSVNVLRNGMIKNKNGDKQRYICKDCNKTFYEDSEFKGLKTNPKLITLTMDLYYKGLSLRDISDTIHQFYGFKVSHETIRNWIMRFTKAMNEYVKKFKPNLRETWHADEQAVKVKGDWLYSWNVLDEKTRFLIANHIGDTRSIKDSADVFKKASKVCKRNWRPERVITDKLGSYNFGIGILNVWNKGKEVEHIPIVGKRNRINNNLIERFHGTFRERDKVMRGFKAKQTTETLSEGFRTYYNFLRPHMGISNLTPAQASGISLHLDRNRWLSLLKKSLNSQNQIKS